MRCIEICRRVTDISVAEDGVEVVVQVCCLEVSGVHQVPVVVLVVHVHEDVLQYKRER